MECCECLAVYKIAYSGVDEKTEARISRRKD
jgi:hypothetical protein